MSEVYRKAGVSKSIVLCLAWADAAGVKWLKQLEVPRTLLISVDKGY